MNLGLRVFGQVRVAETVSRRISQAGLSVLERYITKQRIEIPLSQFRVFFTAESAPRPRYEEFDEEIALRLQSLQMGSFLVGLLLSFTFAAFWPFLPLWFSLPPNVNCLLGTHSFGVMQQD